MTALALKEIDFTVTLTGTPNSTAHNLRWSLVEKDWYERSLTSERSFSVTFDAGGMGSHRGKCLVFASTNGVIAGADFNLGRTVADPLYIKITSSDGKEQTRTQTFGLRSK